MDIMFILYFYAKIFCVICIPLIKVVLGRKKTVCLFLKVPLQFLKKHVIRSLESDILKANLCKLAYWTVMYAIDMLAKPSFICNYYLIFNFKLWVLFL